MCSKKWMATFHFQPNVCPTPKQWRWHNDIMLRNVCPCCGSDLLTMVLPASSILCGLYREFMVIVFICLCLVPASFDAPIYQDVSLCMIHGTTSKNIRYICVCCIVLIAIIFMGEYNYLTHWTTLLSNSASSDCHKFSITEWQYHKSIVVHCLSLSCWYAMQFLIEQLCPLPPPRVLAKSEDSHWQ